MDSNTVARIGDITASPLSLSLSLSLFVYRISAVAEAFDLFVHKQRRATGNSVDAIDGKRQKTHGALSIPLATRARDVRGRKSELRRE